MQEVLSPNQADVQGPQVLSAAPALTSETVAVAAPPQRIAATRLEMANLGVTALGFIVTFAATIIAVRALGAQIAAPRQERRATMYHSLLVLPALECLPAHEQEASRLIENRIHDIEQLVECGASLKDARAAYASLVREYRALHSALTYRLMVAARAWRDEQLEDQLLASLEQLVDEVSGGIDQLIHGNPVEPAVADRLRTGVANVLAIIVHTEIQPTASNN